MTPPLCVTHRGPFSSPAPRSALQAQQPLTSLPLGEQQQAKSSSLPCCIRSSLMERTTSTKGSSHGAKACWPAASTQDARNASAARVACCPCKRLIALQACRSKSATTLGQESRTHGTKSVERMAYNTPCQPNRCPKDSGKGTSPHEEPRPCVGFQLRPCLLPGLHAILLAEVAHPRCAHDLRSSGAQRQPTNVQARGVAADGQHRQPWQGAQWVAACPDQTKPATHLLAISCSHQAAEVQLAICVLVCVPCERQQHSPHKACQQVVPARAQGMVRCRHKQHTRPGKLSSTTRSHQRPSA